MDTPGAPSDDSEPRAVDSWAQHPRRGPRAESSWADVEAAQSDVQHRFRFRWWFHLPEAALVTGMFGAVLADDHLGWPYYVLLFALFLSRYLYLGVRKAQPAPGAEGVAVAIWAFVVPLVLVVGGSMGLFGSGIRDAVQRGWLISGLVCGLAFYAMAQVSNRRHLRFLDRAGERLAVRSPVDGTRPVPQLHQSLRRPEAFRAVLHLGLVRDMERSALQDDLGLSSAETTRLLDELVELRLVDTQKKLFAGGWRRTWLSLTTKGQGALGSHLATLRDSAREGRMTGGGSPAKPGTAASNPEGAR